MLQRRAITIRLDEIKAASDAEQRVKRMQANGKSAKDSARQLKVQADMSAERLDMQKGGQRLAPLQRSAVATPIRPCSRGRQTAFEMAKRMLRRRRSGLEMGRIS
jgi:hypothetical protein